MNGWRINGQRMAASGLRILALALLASVTISVAFGEENLRVRIGQGPVNLKDKAGQTIDILKTGDEFVVIRQTESSYVVKTGDEPSKTGYIPKNIAEEIKIGPVVPTSGGDTADNENWWDRNWKWASAVGGAAVVVGGVALADGGGGGGSDESDALVVGTWIQSDSRTYTFSPNGTVQTKKASSDSRTGSGSWSGAGTSVTFNIRWSDGNTSQMSATINGDVMSLHWSNNSGSSGNETLRRQ